MGGESAKLVIHPIFLQLLLDLQSLERLHTIDRALIGLEFDYFL